MSLNKVESFSRTVESLCMKSEADTKMLNIQLKKLVSQDDLNAKSLEDIKNFLTILLRLLDQPQKTDPDEVVPNSPPIQTPLTEIIISSQATPSKISTSSLPASAESDYYYSPISKKKRKL